jgi:ATP-dependent DNA helicase RecQ
MAHRNGKAVRELREKLRERFGFQQFRPGQAEAVHAALDGRDTLVVMPTGSGKSLCFQLPALELVGTTVVVSPLIALMKDQAEQLRRRGVEVATMNSTLPAAEERAAESAIAAGSKEFVYTTAERLARPEFRAVLKKQPIDLFVVDEAHCISEWGHTFRPEYLVLGEAIDDLGRPPVLALTATATRDVVDDIRRQLRIPEAEIVHTGFYRRIYCWKCLLSRGKPKNAIASWNSCAGGKGLALFTPRRSRPLRNWSISLVNRESRQVVTTAGWP